MVEIRESHRWRIASAAVVMQLCLGIIYSWSVFRGPLAQLYGWTKTETIAPYRWSILFFTLAMVIAGLWQDRKGPKLVASVGGVLLGAGCLLAAFIGDTPAGLILAYGVIAGTGVGFAYVTPIATCVKWFPDKRGLVVGMAVMGFGIGSLIFAPLLEFLIGSDPARLSITIPRTFLILSGIFFVVVIGAAQMFHVPPAGWRPTGWNPSTSGGGAGADLGPSGMLTSVNFYLLWLVYFLGASVGLTVIGESAPLIREMAGASAVVSGGVALGIMSFFNGAGRLIWGAASDRAGRKPALIAMSLLSAAACGLLLPGASALLPLLAGISIVGFCYGGYLALMPSMTADFFGARSIGTNYGILFSAWGAAGFVLPGYFASIIGATGRYDRTFYSLAVLSLVPLAAVAFMRKPARD